jgi:AcrR family transcriptional regulator
VYDIHSFAFVNIQDAGVFMAGRKKAGARARGGRPEKVPRADGAPTAELTHDDILRASVRVDPDLRRRSELLWENRSRPTRGPKPALTPDDVIQAAIDIADEDGLSAVTMQAVTARLGYTTMAIYRYFPSKEALYDAIVDAGMGQPPAPATPRGSWRDDLTRLAHAKRAMFCARPWLAELPFVAAPHGPNWLSWLEAALDALARTGLSAPDMGQMLSVIDGYTRGAADTVVAHARARGSHSSPRCSRHLLPERRRRWMSPSTLGYNACWMGSSSM